MKYFRMFLELIGEHGMYVPDHETFVDMPQIWFDEVQETIKVFVLPKAKEKTEARYNILEYKSKQLHMPFTSVWIETISGSLMVNTIDIGEKKHTMYLQGLLATESAPGEFVYYLLAAEKTPDGIGMTPTYIGERHLLKTETAKLMQAIGQEALSMFIDILDDSSMGVVNENQKFKVKGTQTRARHFHKIKKVIYVVPKKERGKPIAGITREIDWTHRWAVRGHWVNLGEGRLGKDRNGVYCVHGWTWRSEHVKGPEDKPLVTDKVRLIKKGIASSSDSQ